MDEPPPSPATDDPPPAPASAGGLPLTPLRILRYVVLAVLWLAAMALFFWALDLH